MYVLYIFVVLNVFKGSRGVLGSSRLSNGLFVSSRVFRVLRFLGILRDSGISNPIFNKGLAFPPSERDRMGIRGLVPAAV